MAGDLSTSQLWEKRTCLWPLGFLGPTWIGLVFHYPNQCGDVHVLSCRDITVNSVPSTKQGIFDHGNLAMVGWHGMDTRSSGVRFNAGADRNFWLRPWMFGQRASQHLPITSRCAAMNLGRCFV